MLEGFPRFSHNDKESHAPAKSQNRFKDFNDDKELMADTIVAKRGKKEWWHPDFIGGLKREDIIKTVRKKSERRMKLLSNYEKEKSPEELRLIGLADGITSHVMNNYVDGNLKISSDDIHIIDTDKSLDLRKKMNNFHDNYISKLNQSIVIEGNNCEGEEKLLNIFPTLCHEIFHAKSFTSFGYSRENKSLTQKQIGLTFKIKDKEYFDGLNEAMTEKLTGMAIDYLYEHSEDEEVTSLFGDLIKKSKVKREDEDYLDSLVPFVHGPAATVFDEYHRNDSISKKLKKPYYILPGSQHLGSVRYRAYMFESYMMEKLIEKISLKTGAQSSQIEDIFATAYFDGKLGELKKVIEDSFGQGMFKKIGSEFQIFNRDTSWVKPIFFEKRIRELR